MTVKSLAAQKNKAKSAIQFWYGENQSLLQVELKRWQQEFHKRHPGAYIERIERSGEEVLSKISQVLKGVGLFNEIKLVILFDFAYKSDEAADYIAEHITNLAKGTFVIIVERNKINNQNKLVKKLKKITQDGLVNSKEFLDFNPHELEVWIAARVKQEGGKISSSTASLLGSLVGNNFLLLEQEIGKLVAYAGTREIKAADLDLLVAQKIEEDVFAVIDAVGRRDFKQAIRKLEEQFAAGASPQGLVGMLAWHLRVLWQVREYLDLRPRAPAKEIAAELNLHPYVVTKVLTQIPHYHIKKLKLLYQELSDLDVKLKSTRLDPQMLFDLFLSRLATTNSAI
ncbi:MAG: DNA polymerase III subunit delta [Patescibacteria group bacterium]